MHCQEIMQAEVFSVATTETVRRAAEIMREADIGFLPVCGDAGDVVGTLTDRDIVLRAVAAGMGVEAAAVKDVMTQGAVTCSTRESVSNAIDKMRDSKVSRLVCLDENGALAGVLSLDDILKIPGFRRETAVASEDLAGARA